MQTPQSVPAAKLLVWHVPIPSHVSAAEHAVAVLLPQALPDALLAPSTHTDDPVVHDVTPALQGLGLVVHVRPGVHGEQTPVLQ